MLYYCIVHIAAPPAKTGFGEPWFQLLVMPSVFTPEDGLDNQLLYW